MTYTVVLTETLWSQIKRYTSDFTEEKGVYLLFSIARGKEHLRCLVREVIPVREEDGVSASIDGMSIGSRSYQPIIQRARKEGLGFGFLHTHPIGPLGLSEQDKADFPNFFYSVSRQLEDYPGLSLILTGDGAMSAQVWAGSDLTDESVCIMVIGDRILAHQPGTKPLDSLYDRQVKWFGKALQNTLSSLHIGIVGCGGTGSAVAEQLARLGVGKLTIIDKDTLERSNVSRVYGSTTSSIGLPKVLSLCNAIENLGLHTEVNAVEGSICYEHVAVELISCDVVFGCTDDQLGRSILNRLAYYYLIPVFDMGVQIHSVNGAIKAIQGRVTCLYPGNACLLCRERLSPAVIASEAVELASPDSASSLRKEGYLVELPGTEPSVVTFTTNIASFAVNELIHRFTGYLGEDRNSTEIVVLFDQNEIRTNRRQPRSTCFCSNARYVGRGDSKPLLGLTWPG